MKHIAHSHIHCGPVTICMFFYFVLLQLTWSESVVTTGCKVAKARRDYYSAQGLT